MKRLHYILAIVIVSVIVNVRETWATDGGIYAKSSVLSTGKWVEIGVTETGINVITPALIQKAGFTDMSRIKVYGYGGALQPNALTEEYLKAHDDLTEIPTYMVDGKKYFYGQGPVSWATEDCLYRTRNPYASYGGYFITEGETPWICTEDSLLQIANNNNAAHHSIYEHDDYALVETGANLFDEASLTKGKDATYTITIPKSATSATIIVTLATSIASTTYTVSSSITEMSVSGVITGFASYAKVQAVSCTLILSATDLAKAPTDDMGNYQVPVTISNTAGTEASGTLYLDYISATYKASNVPEKIEGATIPEASYIYAITNQNHHADESRDLIVIIPSAQNNLLQAQRLCQLHEEQDGITTRIVSADELYSEFSSGTPDINAFRRYLKMLYDRASSGSATSTSPKWVLLMGKAYFDNRGLTGSTDALNLVPVFETDDLYNNPNYFGANISTTSSFCSDDYITCLQDGKYPNMYGSTSNVSFDIAVGRIPASTDAEAKVYVDKVEHYMDSKYNGKWQRNIMFIGGDGNDNEKKSTPFIHISQINENADSVISRHLGYDVKKVLTPSYIAVTSSTGTTYPQATKEIIKQQNAGVLIMNYGGHASANQLSNEKALMLTDFQEFSGKYYSVWITAACETMPYDMSSQCIGVEAVKNSGGGAIAFIGTSRTVYASQNTSINKTLMYDLLTYTSDGTPITLGEAMRRTKCRLVRSNGYKPYAGQTDTGINKHQYNMIGDPALKINLPTDSVSIDEVVSELGEDTIQGLETVIVRGHVCGVDGTLKTYSSSSKAFLKIYDSAEKVVCTLDDNTYPYWNRNKTLFEGVTKFKSDGTFESTFRVPEELNNFTSKKERTDPPQADGKGQILIYVIDGDDQSNTAKGEYNDVIFHGDMDHPSVSEAPEVFCYLNDRNFVNGSSVGATPFFVAELSDSNGLLVSESTGHNLELVVDGSVDMTYNLNSNFTFDYNSYTSGQTYYVLPKLADGYHTLRFRVWNLLGTLATKELTFQVVNSKEPNLVNVFVSKNPVVAGTTLTFYTLSDFTGSSADIYIDIFDTAGRLCNIIPYSNYSLGDDLEAKNYEDTRQYRNRTDLTWTVSGLTHGLYLYRVRMTCDGHNYVSKCKKLIVTQ